MSARHSRGTRPNDRAPKPAPPRAGASPALRRLTRRSAIALALLAAIVVAWAVWHRRPHGEAGAIASMSADSAYATAVRLQLAHRSFESLPYYRRALAARPEANHVAHLNFSGALYNSLYEADTIAGLTRPRWPTSLQRAQTMNECLEQMLVVVQTAPSDRDRALACDRLGRMLSTWGFRWEALLWFSRASQLDRGVSAYADHHDALLHQLRDPTRSRTTFDEPEPAEP